MNYTILAAHAQYLTNNWQCSVAIESSKGHWKAYQSFTDNYPTWEDVQATAEKGRKMQPEAAAATFAAIATAFRYEY